MNFDQKHIRNFCVVAHIDHGKSTLCDRILEKTGAVEVRNLQPQLLDDMNIERERGITIKLNAASTRPGTSTSPTRSAVPFRPAKGRSSLSMRHRASRPRLWQTAISPSTTA